jgi:hypothetical protein
MHGERTASALADERIAASIENQPAAEAAIMALLLTGAHAGIWTRAEIEREMSSSPLDVQDALVALHAGGLIHLHEELVTPTRAAQRMDELDM